MEYTIYVITNEVNSKEYVGVTSDLEGRWMGHKRRARRGHDGHLYNAMRKHGSDQFSIQPVEHVEAREQAYELEKQWIADLDTYRGEGYNMTPGGDSGPILTGEDNPMHGRTGQDHPAYATGEDHPMHGRTGEDNPMHGRSGEDHPHSKLTNNEASTVKWYALNSTLSQREIAQMFGVSRSFVLHIKHGKRWPNLVPKPPANNGQLRLPLGAT